VFGEDLEDREKLARHLAIALGRGFRLGRRCPRGGLDQVKELRAPERGAFAIRAFGRCGAFFGICCGGGGFEVRRLRGLRGQLVLLFSLPVYTDLLQSFSFLYGPAIPF
jgi:hypothetical protein